MNSIQEHMFGQGCIYKSSKYYFYAIFKNLSSYYFILPKTLKGLVLLQHKSLLINSS